MADDTGTRAPSTQAVWPDPARVKRLTELAREPTASKPISDYFPGISPGDPSYAIATKLLKDHPYTVQALSAVLQSSRWAHASRSSLPTRPEAVGAMTTRKLGSVQSPGVGGQRSNVLFETAKRLNLISQASAAASLAHANPDLDVIETLIRQTAAAREVQPQPLGNIIQTLAQQTLARAAQTNVLDALAQKDAGSKLAQVSNAQTAAQQAAARARQAGISQSKVRVAVERAAQGGLPARQAGERAGQLRRQAERLGLLTPAQRVATARETHAQLMRLRPTPVEAYRPLSTSALIPSVREAAEKAVQLFRDADAVAAKFRGSALWFVLSALTVRDLYLFSGLEHAEAEIVVLDALEAVIREGRFVTALQALLVNAPHLTAAQKRHLVHALGHARRGEFLDAVPPLMCGLEGAFVSAARGTGIIDDERRLRSRPSKKLEGAGSIVKEIQLDAEFRTFLRRDVFGGSGNAFRHGDADKGERRQALLASVALIGWLDVFMGLSARATLVGLVSERLPAAISRQLQLGS